MTHTESALLSLLQGATEFLPVSSSGHLQILRQFMPHSDADSLAFVILVHIGTLIAIAWVFRQRIGDLLKYGFTLGWQAQQSAGWRSAWLDHADGRMILAVILATIPTGIVGLLFEQRLENLYENPAMTQWVGYALIGTALILTSSRWGKRRAPANVTGHSFPLWAALVVGMAQSVALIPGISRSGTTIAVALLLGIPRREAAELSFLIAIPAICGATFCKLLTESMNALPPAIWVNALVVSGISGYVFLRLLMRFVRNGHLWYFAPYCAALGAWTIWYFR